MLFVTLFILATVSGLDLSKYESDVVEVKEAQMIYFTSTKACADCQKFEKEWTELASSLKRIQTHAIDLDDAAGAKVATGLGIQKKNLPHILLYSTRNPVILLDGAAGTR